MLGVAPADVLVVARASRSPSTIFVFFGYRQLLFATFDPEVAEVSGVRTARSTSGWR